LTTSVGVSTIIAQGVFIDIGLGNQQEDYYFRAEYCDGIVEAKQLQIRLTYFNNKNRKGLFAGVITGYAKSRTIEIFPSPRPNPYKDRFVFALEVGYSFNKFIRCGVELGNLPGLLNFTITCNLFSLGGYHE